MTTPRFPQHSLFTNFSPEQFVDFLATFPHNYQIYSKGTTLLSVGGKITSIGILLSGRLLVYSEDEAGHSNIVNEILPNQSFGEALVATATVESPFTIVCQSEAEVLYLNYAALINSFSSPYHALLMNNLANLLATKVMAMNNRLIIAAQRRTRDKLLAYLYQQKQQQKSSTITIPLNRQQLADYLFVERSALSFVLMKLQQEGLITYHKNNFVIK